MGFKDVYQRSIFCSRNFDKRSRLVNFTMIFLKLQLFVLSLLFAACLPFVYVHIANCLSWLFNGCNLSPNHVFLVLNSIIAAIAATSKMSRVVPAAERIGTVMTNNAEIEGQSRVGESVHNKAKQVLLRSSERNLDISTSQLTTGEVCPEFGVEERAVSHVNHDSDDGVKRAASPGRDQTTREVLVRSIDRPKPEQALQAAAGESAEEIWKAITAKRQSRFTDRQTCESKAHSNNQAVRGTPTLNKLSRSTNSFSRSVDEMREVPELSCKSLWREPSTGLEELNRKAEEFIARFCEQIRIERQKSIIRYMGWVNKAISS